MAKYEIKAPDGSIIELEGPDGASDAQILQAASAAYAQSGKKETTAQGVIGAVTRGAALPLAGATAGALVGGPAGAAAGAAAGTLAPLVGDPIVKTINGLFGTDFTEPSTALESFLTRIGVANPQTEAERIIQATTAGASGAGGFAATGMALQAAAGQSSPVMAGVGRQLAAQPLSQIAGGAGAGAAGQAVHEQGGSQSSEIVASLLGGAAGARAGSMAFNKPSAVGALQRADVNDAARSGVRLLTSDVMPPRSFVGKAVQAAGERIPFVGTSGIRQAQQNERISAVKNLLSDYGADDVSRLSDSVMADLAKKRGSEIKRYSTVKDDVIERLSTKGVVPVNRATQAIDDQINDLSRRKTDGSNEAIERLLKIRDDIQNRDMFQLEAYRKDELSKIFKDDPVRPISVAAREAGEKAIRKIYDPIRKDMGEFIKQNGDRRDFDKWSISNKRLAETASDMQNSSLKSLLMNGDVKPEVVQSILFRGKPSEVRALYSRLTPEGRAAARSAILSKAGKDASVDVAEGNVVSPDRFSNSVKKLGDSIGVFFTNDDLNRIKGLTRVLNITKRASEASAAPATGVQAVPYLAADVLTSQFGGPSGATVAAATIGGMSRIYESAPVRNLLLKISKTKADSAEEAALAKRIISTINMQAESIQGVLKEKPASESE